MFSTASIKPESTANANHAGAPARRSVSITCWLCAVIAFALAAMILLAPATAYAQDQAEVDKANAERLYEMIGLRKDLDRVWNYVLDLEIIASRSPDAVRPLAQLGTRSDNENVKLASARLLGSPAVFATPLEAMAVAEELLEVSETSAVLKAAAELYASCSWEADEIDDSAEFLAEILEDRAEEIDEVAQVAIAYNWYYLSGEDEPVEMIRNSLKSPSFAARAEAALAIAQVGDMVAPMEILRQLAAMPTYQGMLASCLIDNELIRGEIQKAREENDDRDGTADGEPESFLAAATRVIHSYAAALPRVTGSASRGTDRKWAPEELLAPKRLLDVGCEGICGALDAFSKYHTGESMIEMAERNEGNYGGIGAYVQLYPGDDYITITQPIYSGPAYRAGIRSGDWIVGGNGKDFKGWSVDEVVGELKGPEGTPVTVKILRKGWDEPKVLEITREVIHVSYAHGEMLPGKIGIIKLDRFGSNTDEDLEAQLTELEGQGVKGLILDMRGNPGGLLTTVVNIIDKFLEAGKLITYTQGKFGSWAERRNEFATNRWPARTEEKLPMVVLIDRDSASGSEMTSGSLQDNGRAVVIGETSFGKGIGQSPFRVLSSFKRSGDDNPDEAYLGYTRWLMLTAFEYFLPAGRSINHTGVVPDIHMPERIPFEGRNYSCEYRGWASWQQAEVNRIIGSGAIERYLDEHEAGNEELYAELAEFDNFDTSRYPGFDAFYESLETKLARDDVRRLVRNGPSLLRDDAMRLRAADMKGSAFIQNYQEDPTLQRAIVELAKLSKVKLGAIPQYRFFADRWK